MNGVLAALAGAACLAGVAFLDGCANVVMDGPAGTDPPTFASANHQLDLLVIAESKTITLGDFQPTAWVFEMCETAAARGDDCPADARTVSPYGGIRLQLSPGDHLRMRLINHLPPVPADAENAHGTDPMMNAMLAANPVNIHTHGLIVEPRKADDTDPSYGDYVYVLGYPAGQMPSMVDPDETATDQPIQYDVYIPPDHPSGIYWFHPHVHGLSINHISEGLSGVITIGSVNDYLSPPAGQSTIPTRYFVLKDMQVLSTGEVLDQEDAFFCAPFPLMGVSVAGFCQGQYTGGIPDISRRKKVRAEEGGGGADYEGGAWFFTINGQVYPQIPAPAAPGELWRLLNAGASRAYDLVLQDDATATDIPFQVVSLDGVALAPPSGASVYDIRRATADRVDPVPCLTSSSSASAQPVCATHLLLFPSARAEIWISPQSSPATLQTLMVDTGPGGDLWPEVALAHVVANQTASSPARASVLAVRPVGKALLSSQGLLGAPVRASFAGVSASLPLQQAEELVSSRIDAPQRAGLNARQIAALETRLHEIAKPVSSMASPACAALPAGHRRRIFFGIPSTDANAFGLGYEEVDQNGNPLPGTFQDLEAYDPAKISICLPLGPGNTPVTEEWELVNVAAEAHNFHVHQSRFYVEPQNSPAGDAGALMDNVALPNGGAACDGTVATWRSGACPVQTLVVRIPFSQVGDFVYHCHIGEHQDGGMMAHIRVIASQ